MLPKCQKYEDEISSLKNEWMCKLHLENDKHYGKHLINCINILCDFDIPKLDIFDNQK